LFIFSVLAKSHVLADFCSMQSQSGVLRSGYMHDMTTSSGVEKNRIMAMQRYEKTYFVTMKTFFFHGIFVGSSSE